MNDAEKKFVEKLYFDMAAKLLVRAKASLGDKCVTTMDKNLPQIEAGFLIIEMILLQTRRKTQRVC